LKNGAKIHIKRAKSKRFGLGVGFTMGFCGISVFSGTKKQQRFITTAAEVHLAMY
jgi:hypothetical protein